MGNKIFKLDEASLGRVYQHVSGKSPLSSWGMITAYRSSNSKKDNIKANKRLQSDIRSENLGYFEVEGHWRECQDPNIAYEDCPDSKLKDSIEVTMFVPGISKDTIADLCKDTEGKVVLIFRNGNMQTIGSKFEPNKVAQAYSVVKNRSFLFKEREDSNLSLKNLIPKF